MMIFKRVLGQDTLDAHHRKSLGAFGTVFLWLGAKGPTAKMAICAYLSGAALAAYWTLVSPLSFGASLPVFVITGAIYWFGCTLFVRRPSAVRHSEEDY